MMGGAWAHRSRAAIDFVEDCDRDTRAMSPTGAIGGSELATSGRRWLQWGRDVVVLLKLRITTLVIITSLGGMALAVRLGAVPSLPVGTAIVAVVGLAMVVTSANILNMYLEREGDALMERTRDRPLPTGRLSPALALWIAFVLAVLALPVLAVGVNGLTAALAAWALALYAGFYTPLKRITCQAVLVGAVPGALPPLIGWTAVTGEVSLPGLALFGVLFFWQIPHFLAIGTLYLDEYSRAGVKVLPAERPMAVVRGQAMAHCVALVVVSLLLALPIGAFDGLGVAYFGAASMLGVFFLQAAAAPCDEPRAWARRLFHSSLIYLTALFLCFGLAAWI